MHVSLSLSLLRGDETNTTLTNQLAVNHPRARNNLHTRAQCIYTYECYRAETCRRIYLLSPPSVSFTILLLTLAFEESDETVRRQKQTGEAEDARARRQPEITGSRK